MVPAALSVKLWTLDIHFEDSVLIGTIQTAFDKHIFQGYFVTGNQINVTFDTGQTEEIPIFQIGSVAPFEHLNGQQILSTMNVFGNVELGSCLEAFE